jgi:uncharacterized protein (DUF2141 family)
MKTILIGAAALALAGLATAASAAPVHVTLLGVQPRGGHLMLELQTRQQYTQVPFAAGTIADGSAQDALEFDFDLPPGEYAASVLHDANGDFQLNSNAAGVPQEGVASSGLGGSPKGGRASFDDAAFQVGPKGAAITMVMRYPN